LDTRKSKLKEAIKKCEDLITGFKCKTCNKKDKIKNLANHVEENHKDDGAKIFGVMEK